MARTSLPPGFRFHPTDVELIMYYLKRKVMGKKFHFEAIAELNIYKFGPWDLPDKSLLKSKDLEWYFFYPREKKYASGIRTNRLSECGNWKTTGKDRSVLYNQRTVGMIKTLVFHKGHASKGERTDWVMHEYRIEVTSLADVVQFNIANNDKSIEALPCLDEDENQIYNDLGDLNNWAELMDLTCQLIRMLVILIIQCFWVMMVHPFWSSMIWTFHYLVEIWVDPVAKGAGNKAIVETPTLVGVRRHYNCVSGIAPSTATEGSVP